MASESGKLSSVRWENNSISEREQTSVENAGAPYASWPTMAEWRNSLRGMLTICNGTAFSVGIERRCTRWPEPPQSVYTTSNFLREIATMWTIEKRKDGFYKFKDDDGNLRGSYRDPDVMANHHVFAIQELDRLKKLIADIDRTLRVPAAEYVPAIGDVFKLIDAAKPKYEKISVGE
jgi:hypothetical protein